MYYLLDNSDQVIVYLMIYSVLHYMLKSNPSVSRNILSATKYALVVSDGALCLCFNTMEPVMAGVH